MKMILVGILFLVVAAAMVAHAADLVLNPSMDWQTAITGTIDPGTNIIMEAGTYTATQRLTIRLNGNAGAPITWAARAGASVKVVRPDALQNLVDLAGNYFTVANMSFEGGSRGLRVGDGVSTLTRGTFSNLSVRGTESTSISCNDLGTTYTYFTFDNVAVSDTNAGTSECFYVGCTSGTCTFAHGTFTSCSCYNTLLADPGYGSGIQIKPGSYNNTVKYCSTFDTKGPGLLIYDDYGLGENKLIGNLVVNAGDYGIQFTAGATVANNVIINSSYAAIGASLNSVQTTPMNLKIIGNTAVSTDCMYAPGAWNTGSNIQVNNNALLCGGTALEYTGGALPSSVTFSKNARLASSTTDLASTFVNLTSAAASVIMPTKPYNLYPSESSVLAGSADSTGFGSVTTDFACQTRASPSTIGAYQKTSATNPGPALCNLYPVGAPDACTPHASSFCAAGTTGLTSSASPASALDHNAAVLSSVF